MVKIDAYSFGKMTINGESYRKDVMIYPDETILCPWWRESGHKLATADIQSLLEKQPDIIVVGTGSPGLMVPANELKTFLEKNDIELIALPTQEAVKVYNDLSKTKRTGGCFHLTC